MATLTLVLPVFTRVAPGIYTNSQLVFVAASSGILWACFIFVQTVRHRDYFTPEGSDLETHAELPTNGQTWISFGYLLLSLVTVVGLAKKLSPAIERAVEIAHAPRAIVGTCYCHACAAARNLGGGAGCSCQPSTNQHEPCGRFRAGLHRAYYSGGRASFYLLPFASCSGPFAERHGSDRANIRGQQCHVGHRPHLPYARCSTPCLVRSISLPRLRSVSNFFRVSLSCVVRLH